MSTIIVHAKAALLGKGQEVVDDATLVAVAGVIQQIGSRYNYRWPRPLSGWRGRRG